MKNENVPDIEQGLHERLCAYVFGELQGAERAAFEAELLRSPELQRERERLTATIGLVKSAVPDVGLSTAVRRDLVASARRSRFRFLSGRSIARLAAAVVLIGGGLLGLRAFNASRLQVEDAKVARLDVESRVEAARESEVPDSLRGLGYVGGSAGRAKAADAPPAILTPQELSALKDLAYGGGEKDHALAAVPLALDKTMPAADGPQVEAKLEALEERESVPGDFKVGGVGHYGTGVPSAFAGRRSGDPVSRAAPARTAQVASQGSTLIPPLQPGTATLNGGSEGAFTLDQKSLGTLGLDYETSRDELTDAAELSLQKKASANEVQERADAFYLGRQPAQTREQVAAQVEQLLAATRLAPGESPRDMFFRYWGDSPFRLTEEDKLSTFAVDVDTASYALARAYLNRGELPPREAVRTEEFVNYFKADQAAPTDGKPFAIGMELAPSLFAKDTRAEMLRVTVRAKDVADFERKPVALTFVIDHSGSMAEGGRLELVKRSLMLLLRQLDGTDSVAIVTFSQDATLVTPALPAARRGELEALIDSITTAGGTNVEAGLRLGYEQALQNLARNAVNRVILCSDGVGNIGETTSKGILAQIDEARKQSIYLNTVGVGMGNLNDAFLEEFADKGDGVCNYVDSDAEAKRVFVDNLASAIQPVARDVKIQVEFDPAQVESWRLLGYENRALRAQDFRNDKVDAGEVNAGHQVSALYELVRRPSRSAPLATVRVRYKAPFAIDEGREGARANAANESALELERTLSAASILPGFAGGTNGYQRAVLVAQFAEVLRQSVHARHDSFADLLREARRLQPVLHEPDFDEFVGLLGRANPLLDARAREETPHVQELLDRLSQLRYEEALRERHRELQTEAGEHAEPAAGTSEDAQAGLDARTAIQQLEDEVRAELERRLEPPKVK